MEEKTPAGIFGKERIPILYFLRGSADGTIIFEGFKRYIEESPIYRDMVLIEIEPCQAETMRVIGKAEKYVKKNKLEKGQIWCVYDKDSFPAKDFNGVVHRTEYIKFLNDKFQELGIGKYQKNMKNIFDVLMNAGSPKLAIRYAKRIIKDGEGKTPTEITPGTTVYELVEGLAKYLPEDKKEYFE